MATRRSDALNELSAQDERLGRGLQRAGAAVDALAERAEPGGLRVAAAFARLAGQVDASANRIHRAAQQIEQSMNPIAASVDAASTGMTTSLLQVHQTLEKGVGLWKLYKDVGTGSIRVLERVGGFARNPSPDVLLQVPVRIKAIWDILKKYAGPAAGVGAVVAAFQALRSAVAEARGEIGSLAGEVTQRAAQAVKLHDQIDALREKNRQKVHKDIERIPRARKALAKRSEEESLREHQASMEQSRRDIMAQQIFIQKLKGGERQIVENLKERLTPAKRTWDPNAAEKQFEDIVAAERWRLDQMKKDLVIGEQFEREQHHRVAQERVKKFEAQHAAQQREIELRRRRADLQEAVLDFANAATDVEPRQSFWPAAMRLINPHEMAARLAGGNINQQTSRLETITQRSNEILSSIAEAVAQLPRILETHESGARFND